MGTKRYTRKKPPSTPVTQRLVTPEERKTAAESLNKMSREGYGDASLFFSAAERKKIMDAAGRNLLSK